MCLPVEVTRTLCRNSFLNKFTSIRPPNKWIATRPGRFNHVSSQGLETDQSLSTCFNFNHIVLTVLFACPLVDGEIFHYLCAVIFLLHYMAMPMLMMECGWEFIAEFVCLANIELYRA